MSTYLLHTDLSKYLLYPSYYEADRFVLCKMASIARCLGTSENIDKNKRNTFCQSRQKVFRFIIIITSKYIYMHHFQRHTLR